MKVAMITPYFKETIDCLKRCHFSVKYQTYPDVTHIMVADGNSSPLVESWKGEHISLPESHTDAGATPRAIAAISAFSRGYDVVGFIDADNWLDNDHVEVMLKTLKESDNDGVIATRRIMHKEDSRELYVDRVESNGDNMVDTNCMFLTRKSLNLMTYWVTEPGKELISDRHFWGAVKHFDFRIARSLKPTVNYVTKWAWHYEYAGVEIPPDSVWLEKDEAGNFIHMTHEEKGRK